MLVINDDNNLTGRVTAAGGSFASYEPISPSLEAAALPGPFFFKNKEYPAGSYLIKHSGGLWSAMEKEPFLSRFRSISAPNDQSPPGAEENPSNELESGSGAADTADPASASAPATKQTKK